MDQTPPIAEGPPPVPETTSLASRMMNVFASPGEVFEEVKRTPNQTTNWLVPAILAAVVGVVATVLIFSQPTIKRQIREQQEKAFQQQVNEGKMTQQDADKILAGMEKFMGPMMMVGGSLSVIAMAFGRLFLWGLVMWLIARWLLKVDVPYLKMVAVAGLSSLIITLGGIVQLLLGVILGKMMATVSLALFLKDFEFTNRMHFLLAAVNLFKLWAMVLLGLGLARLTASSWAKATLLMLIYWAVFSLVLIGIGLGQFTL
jgi:hypothetical protein